MGCLVTRDGMHRHSYAPVRSGRGEFAGRGGDPERVMLHGFVAVAQSRSAGAVLFPVSTPVATFAADGAPFYNDGYLPGYSSVALPGGEVGLALPPRAAQLDLTDRSSWDRPVWFPSAS